MKCCFSVESCRIDIFLNRLSALPFGQDNAVSAVFAPLVMFGYHSVRLTVPDPQRQVWHRCCCRHGQVQCFQYLAHCLNNVYQRQMKHLCVSETRSVFACRFEVLSRLHMRLAWSFCARRSLRVGVTGARGSSSAKGFSKRGICSIEEIYMLKVYL